MTDTKDDTGSTWRNIMRGFGITVGIAATLALAMGVLALFGVGPFGSSEGTAASTSTSSSPVASSASPSPSVAAPTSAEASDEPGSMGSASSQSSSTPATPSAAEVETTSAAPKVYDDVPLIAVCTNCSGTVQVGEKLFSYNDGMSTLRFPEYSQQHAFEKVPTTCTSLVIQVTGSQTVQNNGSRTIHFKVVQSDAEPYYTTVVPGVVGELAVELDGGPVYFNAAYEGQGTGTARVHLNIKGNGCSTPDGVPL